MKKLLCFTLTAVLAATLAAPAFAEVTLNDEFTFNGDFTPTDKTLNSTKTSDSTEVKFSVDPTYTVTIPATVTLEQKTAQDENKTVTYEKDLTVTAENVRLNEGKVLQISLGSDFQLGIKDKPALTKLPYKVTVGEEEVTSTKNQCAVFETNTADQKVTLHFAAGNPTYAGDYTDTVTFTLAVIDKPQNGTGAAE